MLYLEIPYRSPTDQVDGVCGFNVESNCRVSRSCSQVHLETFISQSRLHNKQPWLMSDEDVPAEDTRYICGICRRLGGTVIRRDCATRFMAAFYRFAIFREASIYRALENRCASVASKYDEIFNCASPRRHGVAPNALKINRQLELRIRPN